METDEGDGAVRAHAGADDAAHALEDGVRGAPSAGGAVFRRRLLAAALAGGEDG